MYQDSGLLLRGASGAGFAGRRAARRMEQGVVAPRAWRSTSGAVLRLLPDHLGALAAEVRAAVHPAHPAAADPQGAVLHHVAGLARAARPAGTMTDRATGRTLHVFRAPGRVGEMEIVTAPPRGALYDIVEVRPAGMQGELEVYADKFKNPMTGEDLSRHNGVRVRGPHATLNWGFVDMAAFMAQFDTIPEIENVVYVLARKTGFKDPEMQGRDFLWPRYVGVAAKLKKRWEERVRILRLFNANVMEYELWIGRLDHPDLSQVHGVISDADREKLLRQDIEHVLIRDINNKLPLACVAAVLTTLKGQLTSQNLFNGLAALGVVNGVPHHAVLQTLDEFVRQGAQADPSLQHAATVLLEHLPVQKEELLLANRQSISEVWSDSRTNNKGGIEIINNMIGNTARPWFLRFPFKYDPGEHFEISADVGTLLSAGT